MSSASTVIDSLIACNLWIEIEKNLNNKRGVIYPYGGRYICGALVEFEGYVDINKLCLSILNVITSDSTAHILENENKTITNIVKRLRRLYDETQNEIGKTSTLAFLATIIYDIWEMASDRTLPIDRLESAIESSKKVHIKHTFRDKTLTSG